MERVAIIFASNDRYAILLGVALCSLFENKKGNYPIDLYVVDFGISAKNKERLGILERKYGFTINYIVPDAALFQKMSFADLSKGFYAPPEAFHRVYLGRFLPPDCHRVINLEADMLVRGDIAELFEVGLGGKTIGVVADCYQYQEERRKYLRKLCREINWPLPREGAAYFSVGMLLVDLERWRKRGVEEKLLDVIYKHPDKLYFHENDAFNIVLANDFKELSSRYHLLTEQVAAGGVDKRNSSDPLVVHFVGGGKPWYFFSALPYQSEYVYYANKTPWRKEKYRKLMDVYFAKKYHIYPLAWGVWLVYKKLKSFVQKLFGH